MISKEIELKIIENYQSGLSSTTVGEMFGVSSVSVRNVLKRNGINIRTQSEAQPRKIGSASQRWKGGSWLWVRKQIVIRDDYTCQICGLREPEIMMVDHILPKSMYPELKLKMNNLITLCPNCHARKTIRERKTHNYKVLGEK